MGNELKMAQVHAIEGLWRQGWSCRRIARELGIHRDTVRRHVKRLKGQAVKTSQVTAGSGSPAEPVPADSKPATEVTTGSVTSRSRCERYRDVIAAKLDQHLSAQRIYQDLVADAGYVGSYESVKRFVRMLEAASPLPFRRIETEPGKECQVDFGQGAWVERDGGRKKRPWLFRIVLSHSRKAYSEVVWQQTTENFIRAIENAFHSWGGRPETVVIDNLKAAVTKADWFDPVLNPKIEEFARHYGIVILPTKPAMPRHKGKIESGVNFAQENALKAKTFKGLAPQNEYLRHWESTVADLRIHGTTRRQVKKQFEEVERPALKPLPAERFPFFHEGRRRVHTDGHVEVERSYYSVPPELLGEEVWIRYDAKMVRVFNAKMEIVASHVRKEPGRFSTLDEHISSKKISAVEKGASWLLGRAQAIGTQAALWAKSVMENRGIQGIRVVQGLLSLRKYHTMQQIDAACELALGHGAYRLQAIRALIKRPAKQENLEFMAEHPLIRSMEEYSKFVETHFRKESV